MKRSSQSDEQRGETKIIILLSYCWIEIEQELRQRHEHVLSNCSAYWVWHDLIRISHLILEPVEREKENTIGSKTHFSYAPPNGTIDSPDSRIFFLKSF